MSALKATVLSAFGRGNAQRSDLENPDGLDSRGFFDPHFDHNAVVADNALVEDATERDGKAAAPAVSSNRQTEVRSLDPRDIRPSGPATDRFIFGAVAGLTVPKFAASPNELPVRKPPRGFFARIPASASFALDASINLEEVAFQPRYISNLAACASWIARCNTLITRYGDHPLIVSRLLFFDPATPEIESFLLEMINHFGLQPHASGYFDLAAVFQLFVESASDVSSDRLNPVARAQAFLKDQLKLTFPEKDSIWPRALMSLNVLVRVCQSNPEVMEALSDRTPDPCPLRAQVFAFLFPPQVADYHALYSLYAASEGLNPKLFRTVHAFATTLPTWHNTPEGRMLLASYLKPLDRRPLSASKFQHFARCIAKGRCTVCGSNIASHDTRHITACPEFFRLSLEDRIDHQAALTRWIANQTRSRTKIGFSAPPGNQPKDTRPASSPSPSPSAPLPPPSVTFSKTITSTAPPSSTSKTPSSKSPSSSSTTNNESQHSSQRKGSPPPKQDLFVDSPVFASISETCRLDLSEGSKDWTTFKGLLANRPYSSSKDHTQGFVSFPVSFLADTGKILMNYDAIVPRSIFTRCTPLHADFKACQFDLRGANTLHGFGSTTAYAVLRRTSPLSFDSYKLRILLIEDPNFNFDFCLLSRSFFIGTAWSQCI